MEKIVSTNYKIRFNDCDPFGHLNNARYLDYFLNAREDHLKEFYNFELMRYAQESLSWVVSSHEIIYLRPASYNEQVVIRSCLLKASNDSLKVEMIMLDARLTHIKALLWTKFTMINIKTGKKVSHPEEFMVFANSLLVDEAILKDDINERLAFLKKELPGR